MREQEEHITTLKRPERKKRKARGIRGGRVCQFGCFIFKVSRVTKRKGERERGERGRLKGKGEREGS